MELEGLPDFQNLLTDSSGLRVYYPYQSGPFAILPGALAIPTQATGDPELSLTIVRGSIPSLPPEPYGVLDLHVEASYPMDAGLALARAEAAAATVVPAELAGGFLRLAPQTDDGTVPAGLQEPVPIVWGGLDWGRFTLTLPIDIAEFFKSLLAVDGVALVAHAEVELWGVAPRLPLQVQFDPAALLAGIRTAAEHDGLVAFPDLLAYFRAGPGGLPLQVTGGSDVDPQLLAQTLTDWLRLQYGTFAPAPALEQQTYMRLAAGADVGSGSVTWDLSVPQAVPRPVTLDFDPLSAARILAQVKGIGALVTESVVPPVPTGQLAVTVTANLPRLRLGALQLGVRLEAPSHAPVRMQAISASAELAAPADSATIHLRFAPGEPEVYRSHGYAVLVGAPSGPPAEAPPVARSGRTVRLTINDFPVDFIPVSASASLIDLCTIDLHLQPGADTGLPAQTAQLDHGQLSVAFTQPHASVTATLTVAARPRDGGAPLELTFAPPRRLTLDLGSFATYGPHQVSVTASFLDSMPNYAIELLAEGQAETPDSVGALNLTPTEPTKSWGYVAASPFHAGYRWREYHSQPPPAPWSAVLDPAEPLQLSVGSAAPTDAVNAGASS